MGITEWITQTCPTFSIVLKMIGFVLIIRAIFSLAKKISILMRKRKDLTKLYGEESWAFITGSSDGIGKGLAFGLAKEGFNIILSARTVSKMEKIKEEITAKYPQRKVKVVAADYKKAISYDYIKEIIKQIEDLDVSIVINNVGLDDIAPYHTMDPKKSIQDQIRVNCYPVCYFCYYLIPRLQKRQKKGCIVNVSSIAGGTIPMAYYNIYAATKAYVDRLTINLAAENPDINFLSLRPSEVSTSMNCYKLDIFTITVEQCVNGLLDQFGYADVVTYGHWRHQLQGWIYESIPQSFFNFIFKNFVAPADMKHREEYHKKAK